MPIDTPVEMPELGFEAVDVKALDEDDAESVDCEVAVVADDRDDEDEVLDATMLEVGCDEDKDAEAVGDGDDDLEPELDASASNSDTGKVSVWPSVALSWLLQAAFIVSRTVANRDQQMPRGRFTLYQEQIECARTVSQNH
jgi:hypothetical protein